MTKRIQYVIDGTEKKKAVLIDLSEWGETQEDIYDTLISQSMKDDRGCHGKSWMRRWNRRSQRVSECNIQFVISAAKEFRAVSSAVKRRAREAMKSRHRALRLVSLRRMMVGMGEGRYVPKEGAVLPKVEPLDALPCEVNASLKGFPKRGNCDCKPCLERKRTG